MMSHSGIIFAAGDGGLIVMVIIAIISGISTWLQKRKQQQQEGVQPDQGRSQVGREGGTARTPAADWEEELKRLLGQTDEAPPPPPPVVIARRPPPVPAPLPPVVVRQEPRRPSPPPVVVRTYETAKSRPTPEQRELVVAPPALAVLKESKRAFATASQLQEITTARLAQVTKKPVAMTHAEHRQHASAEIRAAVAMLRQPRTARQAFVAGQIFGPPRGLQPAEW